MRRKRDTPPEALLQRVITALENDRHSIYRGGLLALLAEGPLFCTQTLLATVERPDEAEMSLVRAEMLAYLRYAVKAKQFRSEGGYGIWVRAPMRFVSYQTPGGGDAVTNGLESTMRATVIIQLILLLQTVGLRNVLLCGAADCQRLVVKTYRREFCSVRCQQRDYKRRLRQRDREQLEQQKKRVQRRRVTAGSKADG